MFAAHHFDVTDYTDDEIGRAICTDIGMAELVASHDRLAQAFERLRSER